MTTHSAAFLVLGNQLFGFHSFKKYRELPFFMAEDRGLCTHFRYHKHKLVYFLASMREFASDLKKKGLDLTYHELKSENEDYFERLAQFCHRKKISTLHLYEIEDKFFESQLSQWAEKEKIDLVIEQSSQFLFSREDFKAYLAKSRRPLMKNYYEERRKRTGYLMEDERRPIGGKFSYDAENRKKLPKTLTPPDVKFPFPNDQSRLEVVKKLVDKEFSSHPGRTENFWAPVTRRQALNWLDCFLKKRLQNFGTYEDALSQRSPFLFHSALSLAMNIGHLDPKEVIEKAIKHYENDSSIPLNSIEGFVRQIMGWREFIRGIYQNFSDQQEKSNFFGNQRGLTQSWYDGTTEILPLDLVIKKTQQWAYSHHIERLMIVGNLMTLCEIKPQECHRWFMEMYIDSSDWVMGPNVYGMGIFSDGGIFATKPYCASSNYMRKMGDYPKGEWENVVDGLYWRFIDKHRSFFESNPRTPYAIANLKRLKLDRKKKIFEAAEKFLEQHTK